MTGGTNKNGTGYVELQRTRRRKSHNNKHPYDDSDAVAIKCTYPLKILIPDHVTKGPCKWIYPITFGGGLVGGDKASITVNVGDRCCGLVTSQESTKIYHCKDGSETSQNFHFTVGSQSLLCVIPDYLVCYRDANYRQCQKIDMSSEGNLVFLDWMTAGRVASGEEWHFRKYDNSTQLYIDNELAYRDRVCLQDQANVSVSASMKHFKVMGVCLIVGKSLKSIADHLYQTLVPPKKYGEKPDSNEICSVSRIQNTADLPFLYIRFLTVSTQRAQFIIRKITDPLIDILGGDPFQNKYY